MDKPGSLKESLERLAAPDRQLVLLARSILEQLDPEERAALLALRAGDKVKSCSLRIHQELRLVEWLPIGFARSKPGAANGRWNITYLGRNLLHQAEQQL
jgi:hypothetical protein